MKLTSEQLAHRLHLSSSLALARRGFDCVTEGGTPSMHGAPGSLWPYHNTLPQLHFLAPYRPRTPYNPTHLNNHHEMGDEALRYLHDCYGLLCCAITALTIYIDGWVRLEACTRLFESCYSTKKPTTLLFIDKCLTLDLGDFMYCYKSISQKKITCIGAKCTYVES